MADTTVVLLLVACFTSIHAQYQHHQGGPHGQQSSYTGYGNAHLLTCIASNEARDQIRITLTEDDDSLYHSPAFKYGNTDPALERKNWRISALFIPAQALGLVPTPGTASLSGTFFLAVTKYGRTEGRCAGLGGVLMEEDLIRVPGRNPYGRGFPGFGNPYASPFSRYGAGGLSSFGGLGRHGSFGGLGSLGSFGSSFGFGQGAQSFNMFGSRYGGSFSGNRFFGPRPPPGIIKEPIIAGRGGNVYTSVLKGLSLADLSGRGIAMCLDGHCYKPTTTCCSIVKDMTAATESVGQFQGGPINGNDLLNQVQNGGLNNGFINNNINNNILGNGNAGGNGLIIGGGEGALDSGAGLF